MILGSTTGSSIALSLFVFFFALVFEIQAAFLSLPRKGMPENFRSAMLMQVCHHASFCFLKTGRKASVIYAGSTGVYTVLPRFLTAR